MSEPLDAEALDSLVFLGQCPAVCDEDCRAECHEAHKLPFQRAHEPGTGCEETRRLISAAVLAERERAAGVADLAGAAEVAKMIRAGAHLNRDEAPAR